MKKTSKKNEIDRERYKKVLDFLDKEYFVKVFNMLTEEWQRQRKEEGERSSLRALADEIGVSNTNVGDWMSGKHPVERIDNLMKICKAFNKPPEVFATNSVFTAPEYSFEQIKALDTKCAELEIDKNILLFLKDNYSIPHKVNDDPFDYLSAPRNRAPENEKSDYIITEGSRPAFLDEDDLDLVLELQNKIKELTQDFLTKKAIKFQKDFVKEASGWAFVDGAPGDENYDGFVQNVIDVCPDLDPDFVIKSCTDAYKRRNKRKKK